MTETIIAKDNVGVASYGISETDELNNVNWQSLNIMPLPWMKQEIFQHHMLL